MLNPFPDFLTFSFFAPLLLRLALGAWFLFIGYRNLRTKEALGGALAARFGKIGRYALWPLIMLEVALGALFIAGMWTQVAALFAALYTLKLLYFKKSAPLLAPQSRMFYLLVFIVALSLLLTGAGAFAVDSPL